MTTRIRVVGERALLVTTASPVAFRSLVLRAARPAGLTLAEVVPAAETVLIQVASGRDLDALRQLVVALLWQLESACGAEVTETAEVTVRAEVIESAEVTVPVRFDGADLDWVAATCGLAAGALIDSITETVLTAAFTGFAPGFAYLTGLPPALQLPRRAVPRTRVAAGSFAIADHYAGIYPQASPGGWHLLGTTELVMFDPARTPIALIAPGTRVRIEASR